MNADDVVTWGERLFFGMFLFLYFGVPLLVVWASYCEKCFIDMRGLWTHNNKADKLAVIILGTWWIHACTMILWTMSKVVTTQDFVVFLGWALPIIAKMYSPNQTTVTNGQSTENKISQPN